MRTGVVIVSHGDAGQLMIEAAEQIVGRLDTRIVTVPFGEAREITAGRIDRACAELSSDETLFLVDLEGSTPFNLCSRSGGRCVVLSGVNMPMLFKLATANREQHAIDLAEELRATGMKGIHIRTGGSPNTEPGGGKDS